MTIPFQRFLVTETLAVTAFNAGINAAYTSYLWRADPLTVSQIAVDLAGTPAVIALLATLFGTAAVRSKVADGRIDAGPAGSADLWPRNILARALLLALVCVIVTSFPLWLALSWLGAEPLSFGAAVTTKVILTVIFSIVIVPIVIRAAADDPRRTTAKLQPA